MLAFSLIRSDSSKFMTYECWVLQTCLGVILPTVVFRGEGELGLEAEMSTKWFFILIYKSEKNKGSETQTRRYERMNYGAAAVQSGRGKRLKCARNMREATGRMMYARMCYMYVRVQLYLASSQKCTSMFIDNWLFKCLNHY